MAQPSVTQWNDEDHTFEGTDWEEQSCREGCAHAREQARLRLKAVDDELLRCKPRGWSVVGFRERTMVTRFGEVVIRRRIYRDEDGRSRIALDEHLGWVSHQQASPSLTESIVSLCAYMPFGKTTDTVSALTAGVLSTSTVYRLVEDVGHIALDEERERCEAQFECGEDMSEGRQRADILYTEADGVWIHLQREARKRYEIKSGIAYRGWRRIAEDRYELVDKRVYCHASEKMRFWEGASVEWAKQYALDGVKQFVVGGDGANWIRQGVDEFGCAVFQLDGFHLSRACGRGYGAQIGSAIYEAIRSGSHDYARALMSASAPAETTTAIGDRKYVESNLVVGMDWRNRVSNAPPNARSLGTMESNGDKLIANRMKKRGMSWTIRGAHRMSKVIQLERNGELSELCSSRRRCVRRETEPPPRQRGAVSWTRVSDWAETSVPALNGPHSSRPWARSLRNLTRPLHLLN